MGHLIGITASDFCIDRDSLSPISSLPFFLSPGVGCVEMPLPTHLPHVLYATALTSLGLHLLSTRKAGQAARSQADARISLLDGLATRLREGENVSRDEVVRVLRLMRENDGDRTGFGSGKDLEVLGRGEAVERDVDWKTMLLGRPEDKDRNRKKEEKLENEWNIGKWITKKKNL